MKENNNSWLLAGFLALVIFGVTVILAEYAGLRAWVVGSICGTPSTESVHFTDRAYRAFVLCQDHAVTQMQGILAALSAGLAVAFLAVKNKRTKE